MKHWLGALLALCAFSAAAKDYLVVTTRPNNLHVIDAAARQVVRSFPIPGKGLPSTITLPKDGKVAYILTNRNESISGIDIDTGREVFRADMSVPGIRMKSMMAMTVSQDGKQLYVHQVPTRLLKNEFQAMDTRIAVYNTADGIGAKPVKTFPAPRRIALLAAGAAPGRFVALGWDLYIFDAAAGKIDKTLPLRGWKRQGLGEPDILDFWPQYEQAGILSTPYSVPRTDVDPQSPEAMQLGVMSFDLETETLAHVEVANAEMALFSSVVNPQKKNEVFTMMNNLLKIDLNAKKIVKQAPTDRTYYAINISSDGKELYLGGATEIISVYDSETLQKKGEIVMPERSDQGTSSLRMVQR